LEEDHYYPYGFKHANYNPDILAYLADGEGDLILTPVPPAIANKYKFNGQEYQDELGLNLYDMDMRDYDPAIGRWLGLDPVTHFSQSPYNAFDNNPVMVADPSGADGIGGEHFTSVFGMLVSTPTNSGMYTGVSDNGMPIPTGTNVGAAWGDGGILPYTSNYETMQNILGYSMQILKPEKTSISVESLSEGEFLDQEDPKFVSEQQRMNFEINKFLLDAVLIVDGVAGLSAVKWGGTKLFVKGLFGAEIKNVMLEGKLANHLFKGEGKLLDTPSNRAFITKVSNGKSIGIDAYGKSWYCKTLSNGKQIYTYTQNGIIKGAGINQVPIDIISRYGLK